MVFIVGDLGIKTVKARRTVWVPPPLAPILLKQDLMPPGLATDAWHSHMASSLEVAPGLLTD